MMNEEQQDEKPKVQFSFYGIKFEATGKFVAKFIERHSLKILVLMFVVFMLGWLSFIAYLAYRFGAMVE